MQLLPGDGAGDALGQHHTRRQGALRPPHGLGGVLAQPAVHGRVQPVLVARAVLGPVAARSLHRPDAGQVLLGCWREVIGGLSEGRTIQARVP